MLGKWFNRFFGRQSIVVTKKVLHLLTCQIHGSHYYECLSLVKAEKIHKDEKLKLIREPGNEYDEYAIEVFTNNDIKLGYVPKNHNLVIAELMDQHCEICATINRVEDEQWEPVSIRIELVL